MSNSEGTAAPRTLSDPSPAWAPPSGPPLDTAPPADPAAPVAARFSSLAYRPDPRMRWGLWSAALAIAVFPAMFGLTIGLIIAGVIPLTPAVDIVNGVATYGIAFVVILLIVRVRGTGSLARDLGFRIRWVDLAIGIGCGLGLRIAVFAVLIPLSPLIEGAQGNLPPMEDLPQFILSGVLLAVIAAPIVEELLCRGLLLRATRNTALRRGRRPGTAITLAVAVSTVVFVLFHAHQMVNPATAIVLVVTTALPGIVHAALAFSTGRLGAAMVSHATFNATGIALALLVTTS